MESVANQGTLDAEDGIWACPWVGFVKPGMNCQIRYQESGEYVFEPFDGSNCAWGTGNPEWRSVPAGYEDKEIIST